MTKIELLNLLTGFGRQYRDRALESVQGNRHMNELTGKEPISQVVVDALLTDFINYVGLQHGVDFALYSSDLSKVLPPVRSVVKRGPSYGEPELTVLSHEFNGTIVVVDPSKPLDDPWRRQTLSSWVVVSTPD